MHRTEAEHRKFRRRIATSPHAVYVLRDEAGVVIYVGCTVNVERRLTAHRSKGWWASVAGIETTWYHCKSLARDAESDLIHEHDPVHNFQGTSRAREFAREQWRLRKAAQGA